MRTHDKIRVTRLFALNLTCGLIAAPAGAQQSSVRFEILAPDNGVSSALLTATLQNARYRVIQRNASANASGAAQEGLLGIRASVAIRSHTAQRGGKSTAHGQQMPSSTYQTTEYTVRLEVVAASGGQVVCVGEGTSLSHNRAQSSSNFGASSSPAPYAGISSAGISSVGISNSGVSGAGISSMGINSAGVSSVGVSGSGVSSPGIPGAGVSGSNAVSAASLPSGGAVPGAGGAAHIAASATRGAGKGKAAGRRPKDGGSPADVPSSAPPPVPPDVPLSSGVESSVGLGQMSGGTPSSEEASGLQAAVQSAVLNLPRPLLLRAMNMGGVKIIGVDGAIIVLNGGSRLGWAVGSELEVLRTTRKVVDAETDQEIAIGFQRVALLRVTQVEENHCEAAVVGGGTLQMAREGESERITPHAPLASAPVKGDVETAKKQAGASLMAEKKEARKEIQKKPAGKLAKV